MPNILFKYFGSIAISSDDQIIFILVIITSVYN